jgi:hypothetical protein
MKLAAARPNDEAGFALATAMFTLAVISALIAASFLPSRLEQQSGYNVSYARQAREAAEAGLAEAVVGLEPAALELLVSGGGALDLGTITLGGMITAHTTVARLTSRVFIVRSRGSRHDAADGELATRTLGLFVRIARTDGSASENGSLTAVIPLVERSWVRLY